MGTTGKDDETSHGLLNVGLALQRAVYRTYVDVKPVITNMDSPSTGKAKMAWTRIGNEEEMLIYRSTSVDGTYTRVGSVKCSTSKYYSFPDSNVESGKVYYCKIRCRSAYGESYKYGEYSNKISCRVSYKSVYIQEGVYMKSIKKSLTILSIAIIIVILIPVSIRAEETVTAKKLSKTINTQLSTAKNITAKAYLGKISKNNYLSTVAVNTKDNILYADWYILGRDKFYIYKNKMYTYSITDKKWKTQNASNKKYASNYSISSKSKTKLLGNSKFEGNSCLALQVKNGTTKSVYYVNKKDNRLVGIVTATGSKKVYTTIDTKTNVKVPSYVLDGRKMNCDTNINEDIKVTAISINGKVDDIKITSYSELTKLINKIKKSKEYKSNKEGMSGVISTLGSYNKKYFKTKSLYLKNYKNCQPESLYAVKKSASSGKMSIILTGYYEPDRVYLAITQPYIVFIEADSKAASSIKNVMISYDKNQYIVPNVKSK